MKPGSPTSGTRRGNLTTGSHLKGISELHDLSFESQIAPLVRLLSQEPELPPDLLRARPWLERQGLQEAQQVLTVMLEQEWSGFLAHLGQVGPWVFAPTVADLQALSGLYTLLVEQASASDLGGSEPASLLGRLWSSGEVGGTRPPDEAQQAERTFWERAQSGAARQKETWAASRGHR